MGKKLEENLKAGYKFPGNSIQIGVSTNSLGYGVNNFVSKDSPIPFFWGGAAEVKSGIALHYHRNIFHARKVFSFDWGAAFSYWQSRRDKNRFCTVSLFPLLRFTLARLQSADIYFNYSVAGPTFISRVVVDGYDTGKHFTFQDFMGMGIYTGKKRNLNAEIRIAHYSNGNLFPENEGLMIPLTFNIGWSFE